MGIPLNPAAHVHHEFANAPNVPVNLLRVPLELTKLNDNRLLAEPRSDRQAINVQEAERPQRRDDHGHPT